MSAVPAGYRLAVLAPDGTVLDTIDLEGADLTKTLGAQAVLDDITTEIDVHIAAAAR